MQKESPRQLRAHSCAFFVTSLFFAMFFSSSFFSSAVTHAQTVNWGVNGAGGSGTWDTTTAEWFNGTTNIPWPSGGDAIFAGASGGTVNIFGFPVVSSITFNTPGYSIVGGIVSPGSSGLTVTTNVDATFGALLSNLKTVTKNGAATLTMNQSIPGTLQLNQGELHDRGFLSTVNLANSPGVVLTLDPSSSTTQISSLTGGGPAGGLVQPVNKPETVTLSLTGAGTNFGGTLADNGAGVLGLDVHGTGTQTLTGVNTFSGPTTIDTGILALSGNGSAMATAMSVSPGATLQLDDSGSVIGNRLSTTAPISLNGGNLSLNGNSTAPVNENAGPLQFAGASTITVNQPGSAPTQLSLAGLTRVGPAVLTVNGPGVSIAGVTNGSTGIVAPYVTTGTDFATVGSNGAITPFTAYASDINTATATDNVRLTPSSGMASLTASSTVGSLNLPSQPQGLVLDLGSHNLTLATGGILGDNLILNGSLSTPSGEFVVTTPGNTLLGITSNLLDSPGGTALTKAGPGDLRITGNNTYTGTTSIMQGTLRVQSDANLGLGTTVHFDGGGVLEVEPFANVRSFVSAKGIDTGPGGGTINTTLDNVEFSGPATGILTKTGGGTLTLDNAMLSSLTVTQGSVVLLNSSSGTVTTADLQAAGSIATFNWTRQGYSFPLPSLQLDIGGPAAATLTIGNLNTELNVMTINFGLGATASDLLAITGHAGFNNFTDGIQFEFQNLGGLTTGVEYQLISLPSGGTAPSYLDFGLAPDLIAAGWVANFTTSTAGVYVEFSRVPEPGTTALLLLQGSVLLLVASRRARSRTSWK